MVSAELITARNYPVKAFYFTLIAISISLLPVGIWVMAISKGSLEMGLGLGEAITGFAAMIYTILRYWEALK